MQDARSSALISTSNDAASSTSTPQSKIPLLLHLPPELISHTLSLLPPSDLQQTSIALKKVLPELPIEKKLLWTHLVVRRGEQLVPLWRRLRDEERGLVREAEVLEDEDGGFDDADDAGGSFGLGRRKGKGKGPVGHDVQTFCMESWKGDADIMNNVLRCLPHLQVIMVNLGINVAPEHLSDMFYEPRLDVQRIEMRFRPYVEQASYYQFLKGSYFDTGIETMYKHWPAIPSFTHLSIVQDLPPRSIPTPQSLADSVSDLTIDPASPSSSDEDTADTTPPTSVSSGDLPAVPKGYTGHGPFPYISEKLNYTKPKTFAQPIVFFDIKCLARFGVSPVARHLTHLRLRVPSRDLAYVLISPPSNVPGRPGSGVLFPSLKYLDISTTNVRLDSVLQTLLKNYTRLEHLILDRVNLFGFAARDKGGELCHELGGVCVTAGLGRSKELERQIAAWEVVERTRFAEAEAQRRRLRATTEDEGDTATRDAREAERRAEEFQAQIAEAARLARRGHRSAAHSTFSLRDRTLRQSRAQTSSSVSSTINLPPQDTLILILPPLPSLKSISIGGEAIHVPVARVKDWEHEFHKGWREGLGKVYGWAGHVAEKYERAVRKAEEWKEWDRKQVKTDSKGVEGISSSSSGSKHTPHKGKKATPAASSSTTRPKPPTTIRLFRYPTPEENVNPTSHPSPQDHTAGLIEITETEGREYLNPYKTAIADAELYTHDHSYGPPCVFCTVPDCEGPLRRGAEGERLDGRGGMGGVHRKGCGHEVGRRTWGWEGF